MKRGKRVAMAVVWPAFLMAGVLEMLVFALVDPHSLHWFGGAPVDLGATALYSLTFLVFWVVVSAACTMTQLLSETATEVNSRSFR
jgi:hypothetical protein